MKETGKAGIQGHIERFLMLEEAEGRVVYIKNNTGAVRTIRKDGSKGFMRFGKKGSPDFLIWKNHSELLEMPDGSRVRISHVRTYFVEVKTEIGVQSDAQRKFQAKVENIRGEYFIVRNLNELKEILL